MFPNAMGISYVIIRLQDSTTSMTAVPGDVTVFSNAVEV